MTPLDPPLGEEAKKLIGALILAKQAEKLRATKASLWDIFVPSFGKGYISRGRLSRALFKSSNAYLSSFF